VKDREYTYNPDAIREPLAGPLGYPGRNTKRGVNRRERPEDYLRKWGNPLGRNARTVWHPAPKPYQGDHSATFSPEIPERCLKAALPPGGAVIDPFAGAGTTAIAALRLGAGKVILIDLNPDYLDEARDRIATTPAPNHVPFHAEAIALDEMTTLYPGDCTQILPSLPENSIDIAILDGPYWLRTPDRDTLTDFHRRNNGMKPSLRASWDQFHSIEDYIDTCERWLTEVRRVLHPKGSMFIFVNQHNAGLLSYTLQSLGIQVMNHIVCYKPNGVPSLSGRRLQCRNEMIIWAIKAPGYRFNYKTVKAKAYPDKVAGVQPNDVWQMPLVTRAEAVGHPAQKPVAIYERLLDMCGVRGGTLLDPMAGSGTAGIAAAQWGMQSILIEREVDYIEMMRKRWDEMAKRRPPPANDDEPPARDDDEPGVAD
jgi:DNA modification methylase